MASRNWSRALIRLLSLAICGVTAAACSSQPQAGKITASTGSGQQFASRDRLAIVTRQGILLWSASAGIRRIGPSLPAGVTTDVSQLAWSPDGRYLAWEQSQHGSGGEELVRVDTRTGAAASWASGVPEGAIAFNGSQPVTVDPGEPYLEEYEADGSTRPIAIAAKPEISTSYSNGFAFTPQADASNHPVAIWKADAQGGRVTRVGALPPADLTSPYEQIVASADGRWIAFEKGDHTDVCGVGPSSRLYLMNTAAGTVVSPHLPVPAGTIWRFGTMMLSQKGVLDLNAFECVSTQEKSFQTVLLEVDHGHARIAARDVVDGQRGPAGQLAVITGTDAFGTIDGSFPGLKLIGAQHLQVNGHWISLPATPTFISWAPQNP